MSYHPGILIPMFCVCTMISPYSYCAALQGFLTQVMGIVGACGNINATSSNFLLKRKFSEIDDHPYPVSPKPCIKINLFTLVISKATIINRGIVPIRCRMLCGRRNHYSCCRSHICDELEEIKLHILMKLKRSGHRTDLANEMPYQQLPTWGIAHCQDIETVQTNSFLGA